MADRDHFGTLARAVTAAEREYVENGRSAGQFQDCQVGLRVGGAIALDVEPGPVAELDEGVGGVPHHVMVGDHESGAVDDEAATQTGLRPDESRTVIRTIPPWTWSMTSAMVDLVSDRSGFTIRDIGWSSGCCALSRGLCIVTAARPTASQAQISMPSRRDIGTSGTIAVRGVSAAALSGWRFRGL